LIINSKLVKQVAFPKYILILSTISQLSNFYQPNRLPVPKF